VIATLSHGAVTGNVILCLSVFLASTVEMVEALTIVVAVGYSQSWKSALRGVYVALGVLAFLVAAFGPALTSVPRTQLHVVVGGILLVFGLQWLRKAVLRSTGYKDKHDEDKIFEETSLLVRQQASERGAFVLSFKGVFLEGLEVVIIVLTMGSSAHKVGLAAITAIVAVVLVAIVGALAARQLSNVPENALKMAVGLCLISYGTFWTGQGMGLRWPGSDAALLVLVAFYSLGAFLMVAAFRPRVAKVHV
jgi:uncharacterized membrane protein